MRKDAISKKTTAKIEKLADGVLKAVASGKNPFLDIPVRSLANVSWSEKRRLVELGDRAEALLLQRLDGEEVHADLPGERGVQRAHRLRQDHQHPRPLLHDQAHDRDTKQNTFDEQEESDPIIEDLEVTMDALREELHLFATNKGSWSGPWSPIPATRSISRGWGRAAGACPASPRNTSSSSRRTRPSTCSSSRRTPFGPPQRRQVLEEEQLHPAPGRGHDARRAPHRAAMTTS